MQSLLKILSIFFFSLFTIAFVLTYAMPEPLEASAEAFLKSQLKKEVLKEMANNQLKKYLKKSLKLGNRLGLKVKEDQLPPYLEELIEHIVLYKLSGESKAAYASQYLFNGNKAEALVENKYDEIIIQLKNDIRIFSGLNLFLFSCLLYILFMQPYSKKLLLPCFLLLAATLTSALFYIFGQDWLYTMLYNDYLGYGYIAYVIIIFLLFMDIAYNRGRVIDAIGQVMQGLFESSTQVN